MKVAIALICVVVGYGLCLVDYNSVIEYLQFIPKEDRGVIVVATYVIFAFITYALCTVFTPRTNDDGWKIFAGLLWLPVLIVGGVILFFMSVDKSLRKFGDKISERKES